MRMHSSRAPCRMIIGNHKSGHSNFTYLLQLLLRPLAALRARLLKLRRLVWIIRGLLLGRISAMSLRMTIAALTLRVLWLTILATILRGRTPLTGAAAIAYVES